MRTSRRYSRSLQAAGHDAAHVRDLGMAGDDDIEVLSCAQSDGRILISADTDFGGLLARSGAALPSVILIRRLQGRRAAAQARLLLEHLPDVHEDLEAGSVVAFGEDRIRVRRLPI